MKKLAALVCFAFLAGLALGAAPVLAAAKYHQMKAEVVSIDLEAKNLTVKDEKGETKTAPVLEKALPALKSLKAGDHVTLTCEDNDKGEHQGVSAIKVDKKA